MYSQHSLSHVQRLPFPFLYRWIRESNRSVLTLLKERRKWPDQQVLKICAYIYKFLLGANESPGTVDRKNALKQWKTATSIARCNIAVKIRKIYARANLLIISYAFVQKKIWVCTSKAFNNRLCTCKEKFSEMHVQAFQFRLHAYKEKFLYMHVQAC